eukprot:TRINITY_DN8027_c0_g1_i3.p1 TRINITY_DN8027_c0_g1~~TRINITY_DN8027_c0_g1_i3.p1  ORF type:complete len:310 (+),score=45.20 TRINITY_DN8027_c0_g1_i3:151-1080(+)
MSCDIWLVRHGETVDNVRGLAQGQNDGKLTDSGIKQAQLLAGRLLRENFARICVSDLGRCRETYAPLQEAGWQCEFCPEVREKACGVLEGRPVGTAAKEAVAAGVPVREYRPQGGESWEDVAARARPFLEGVLLAQQCHGTSSSAASSSGGKEVPKIMVLTHGGFIKEVMNVIFPDDPPSLNAAKNTGIYILRAVRDDAASTAVKRARSGGCGITGWTIRLMVKNDASHLDGGGSGSAYSGLLGGFGLARLFGDATTWAWSAFDLPGCGCCSKPRPEQVDAGRDFPDEIRSSRDNTHETLPGFDEAPFA